MRPKAAAASNITIITAQRSCVTRSSSSISSSYSSSAVSWLCQHINPPYALLFNDSLNSNPAEHLPAPSYRTRSLLNLCTTVETWENNLDLYIQLLQILLQRLLLLLLKYYYNHCAGCWLVYVNFIYQLAAEGRRSDAVI